MNTSSNAAPESPADARGVAPALASAPRPMYWSVLRELWENRSITIAPLAVAAFVLLGFLISMIRVPAKMRAVWALDPAKQLGSVAMPYNVAAAFLLVTAFIVGGFYCLDALHGERRDRSILFWKSLPVSDLTTVLSKASIALLVLPLVTFAVILATQMIMLLLSTAVLLGNGPGIAMLWARLPLFRMSLGLLYALAAIALWHAPIYVWLLFVSGWARRAPFLWAVLPPVAITVVERIAFNTSYVSSLLNDRLFGWVTRAFAPQARRGIPIDPLTQLTPGTFLTTPGLWIGLAFTAIFLAATVRLRRSREPI
jgi:ABC-2 type transport system permease protein